MQSKHFYRLILNVSSKIDPQFLTVFRTSYSDFTLYGFFCFDQNIKLTVADLIFNNDFVDIHFIYTHDHQAYNFFNKLIALDLLMS